MTTRKKRMVEVIELDYGQRMAFDPMQVSYVECQDELTLWRVGEKRTVKHAVYVRLSDGIEFKTAMRFDEFLVLIGATVHRTPKERTDIGARYLDI